MENNKNFDEPTPEHQPVTHGICPDCSELMLYDTFPIHEFLNKLKTNVLLVNEKGIVNDANDLALVYLQKPLTKVKNLPGGNVMECVHSEDPKGCGNTTHCTGCTVRNSVMDTLLTGIPIKKKKAFQLIRKNGRVQKVHLLVTTEKIGNKILLQIEA